MQRLELLFAPGFGTAIGYVVGGIAAIGVAWYGADIITGMLNESATPVPPMVLLEIKATLGQVQTGVEKNILRVPLTPENGGTGDYEQDLQTLTGGTRPSGVGDSAPPGSQIGENGILVVGQKIVVAVRSIDIPANGDKPHETLHYPKKEQ